MLERYFLDMLAASLFKAEIYLRHTVLAGEAGVHVYHALEGLDEVREAVLADHVRATVVKPLLRRLVPSDFEKIRVEI